MKGDNRRFASWLQENKIELSIPHSILDYIYAIDSFIRKRINSDRDIFDIVREKEYKSLFLMHNHYHYKRVNAYNNGLYDEIIHNVFLFHGYDILEYDKIYAEGFSEGSNSTLYIHKGNIICYKHKHPIECVNATVYGINAEDIIINVNYCNICKKLFMSHFQFEQLKKQYKWLIGDFQYVGWKFDNISSSFSDTSPLMLCGYNVRAGHLTETQRRRILCSIIDCVVLAKPMVIKYIEGFIMLNDTRKGLESAVEKWQADLTFIREYRSEQQKSSDVLDLQKYSSSR